MYSYDKQIQAYENEKVKLSQNQQDKLYERRSANRNRLKENLPEEIRIGESHFIPQGSMAIDTTIQEENDNYDIDDGVWFYKEDLVDKSSGSSKSVDEIKIMIKDAVSKGVTFKKSPKIMDNCVRVFYDDGYHVDVPSYRAFYVGEDNECKELAGKFGWKESDPTEINKWFKDRIESLNKTKDNLGGQMRIMIKLLKRFAHSRGDSWDMPNGLKLTMLVEECMSTGYSRYDECFYWLLLNLSNRLNTNLEIENRAQQPPRDKLTQSTQDSNMLELRYHINEALSKLAVLLDESKCTKKAAREAWDWVFKTDGFFGSFDEKEKSANEMAEALRSGTLRITQSGALIVGNSINSTKVPPTKFYGKMTN
jgi:hypothetical protein